MNNNIILGILGAVIIIGGGYYLLKDRGVEEIVTPPVSPGASTPVTPVTAPTREAPTVETGASVSVSSSTAIVAGRVRPNGVATTYWVEYGETTALGSRTTSQQIGSGFAFISTPAYITGLKANTVYYFRVSARNSFATVNGNTNTFSTNNNPPVPGTAPSVTTDSASNISRTGANVNGRVNPNGWQTNYWFEYGRDTSLGSVTSLQGAGSGDSLVSASVALSGLEPLTRYYFRLNAQNQYGTVVGSIRNFTTSGPANPDAPSVTTIAATSITDDGATLNGRVNPNRAETTYWFEYSQDSLLGTIIGTTSPTQTLDESNGMTNVSANISGLSSDTRYYYRLAARNSEGTVYGSVLSFTTTRD